MGGGWLGGVAGAGRFVVLLAAATAVTEVPLERDECFDRGGGGGGGAWYLTGTIGDDNELGVGGVDVRVTPSSKFVLNMVALIGV